MIVEKPYTRTQYAELAIYCNHNNCHIEDKGDYLESVVNTPHEETIQEKLIRLENEYQMNRWQREAILADGSPYSDFTKNRARELEDLAEQIRNEKVDNDSNNGGV